MTKTFENMGRTPKILGLIVCLGALPILFGATGCSTANPDYVGVSPDKMAITQDGLGYRQIRDPTWGQAPLAGNGYGMTRP